jgi:glycine dehydrogenase
MVAIRAEIRSLETSGGAKQGERAVEASALRHAPHPAADVVADDWDRTYPRELGAFPAAELRTDKYWPPVSRIDNVHGDRNVVCSCPEMSAYADAGE